MAAAAGNTGAIGVCFATCGTINLINDHAVGPALAHHALQAAQVRRSKPGGRQTGSSAERRLRCHSAAWFAGAAHTSGPPTGQPGLIRCWEQTAQLPPQSTLHLLVCTANTSCLHLHGIEHARLQRPGRAVVRGIDLDGPVAAVHGADVGQRRFAQACRQAAQGQEGEV